MDGGRRAAEPATLAAGTEVGGYVIDERIGCGGFGEVYAAHQPTIGRRVAVKVLHARFSSDPDAVKRFVDEARAVNRILHPGIVEIFDFGRVAGREYFVMELIEGVLLRDLLAEHKRLSLADALPLLRGIAEAVDAAHAAHIAHRDLKPDNVFVLSGGRTKLIDFGLAKLVGEHGHTETGSVFGTPVYMSPEQCRGRAVDTRTDLYSFGVLAYHVLTGAPPFEGEPLELALKHLNDAPAPPSARCAELSRNVDRVLLALLAKAPEERPPSLGAAVGALAGSTSLRLRRLPRLRRMWPVPVALAAASGIAYLAVRSSSPSPTCADGEDRIAEVWSPAVSERIGARFTRPGDAAVWQLASSRFDELAVRWAGAWTRACEADRETDPLLHVQRQTCLENALVELGATVAFVERTEPAGFIDGFQGDVGGPALSDCDSVAVLRAQPPAPAPAIRALLEPLHREAAVHLDAAYDAWWRREVARAERELAEFGIVVDRIEQLSPPAAASFRLDRLALLADLASDNDHRRRPRVREEIVEAIRRFEAQRNDIALAKAEIMLASFGTEAIDAIADGLARAERAVVRAGRPIHLERDLASIRAAVAVQRGELGAAQAALREALAISERGQLFGTWQLAGNLVVALARGGRVHEAVAEARALVARQAAIAGDKHPAMQQPHRFLAMALELAGKQEEALVEHRITVARGASMHGTAPVRIAWGKIYLLESELRLGREPAGAPETLRAIAGLGSLPAGHNPDALATVRRAGLWSLYMWGVARGLAEPDELADHAATLAYWRGDKEQWSKLAAQTAERCRRTSCAGWIRFSRWLAILADPPVDVAAALAALEAESRHAPLARTYTGVVLAELGRWADARAALEAARGDPHIWENQADLSELDTWLALARQRTGDAAGVRPALEEALRVISISHNGIDGFTYTFPVAQLALADILWKTNAPGDRLRARDLATRARDGFGRLGPHLDARRADAERWLADHP